MHMVGAKHMPDNSVGGATVSALAHALAFLCHALEQPCPGHPLQPWVSAFTRSRWKSVCKVLIARASLYPFDVPRNCARPTWLKSQHFELHFLLTRGCDGT